VFEELDKILISARDPDFREQLQQLHWKLLREARFGGFDEESKVNRQKVLDIVRNVDKRGYEAVREYTNKYDGVDIPPEEFRVSKRVLEKAHKEIDKDLLALIRQAIKNVGKYQTEIYIGNFKHPGIKYTAIQRVGICVPGASAPLPSTVIMTAVPAQVAGVREIVIVSPPRHNKDIHPVTLAVCCELGIDEVYRVGGAQAVAALVTIAKVNKIVGPGNKWVQTAKLIEFGYVGIDSVAGPSEVLIIANEKATPAWVAADMLSQAEHDPGSAVMFTDSQKLAERVLAEVKKQLERLDRKEGTKRCLLEFSKIVVFNNVEDMISAANDFAPEHLEIQCGEKSREIADKIENAGAIFIGDYSPVAVGDYWAGPSHTLPTGTSAKFSSALSANDFIKSTSIIEYSKEQLAKSAEDIIRLAEAEGLDAHAKSVKIRQNDILRNSD
jgi:histidinol dehydrogenase